MKLEELNVYKLSMEIGEKVWDIVIKWDYFVYPVKYYENKNSTVMMNILFHGAGDTMGKQLIRAIDSVAANLSEGFGRYHYKEVKNFCYYSRGSLYESKTWLNKAFNRKLIQEEDFNYFNKEINKIGVKLNNYINSIEISKNKS